MTTEYVRVPVPVQFGGLGLRSTHDLAVGLSRLARGDASVAIAANMHLTAPLLLDWLQRRAVAEDQVEEAEGYDELFELIGDGTIVMSNMTMYTNGNRSFAKNRTQSSRRRV